MKSTSSPKVTHWCTDTGTLITDPAAHGYARGLGDKDCGPDMLVNADGYCERVTGFRACFAAVDGSFKDVRTTLAAALKAVEVRGCAGKDGGVCDDGIVRFEGIQFTTSGLGRTKSWWDLDTATLKLR